eukprot:9063161-Pyramimonas_sp.AAC.1
MEKSPQNTRARPPLPAGPASCAQTRTHARLRAPGKSHLLARMEAHMQTKTHRCALMSKLKSPSPGEYLRWTDDTRTD